MTQAAFWTKGRRTVASRPMPLAWSARFSSVIFDARQLVIDGLIGMAIAAPVYWMFTKLLAINLPGLTHSGWI